MMRERGLLATGRRRAQREPEVPKGSRSAALAVRTWRLQRAALRVELGNLGVPVLDWDGEAELTGGLLHAMRAARPRAAR